MYCEARLFVLPLLQQDNAGLASQRLERVRSIFILCMHMTQ